MLVISIVQLRNTVVDWLIQKIIQNPAMRFHVRNMSLRKVKKELNVSEQENYQQSFGSFAWN